MSVDSIFWFMIKREIQIPSEKTFNMSIKSNRNVLFWDCMQMNAYLIRQCLICIFKLVTVLMWCD